MESISIESFGAEVQVRCAEFFGLAQEKISAGFEIKMEPLEQRNALCAREVRQHVHAEDAIEASNVAGAGEVHAIERHQAAQAWLH